MSPDREKHFRASLAEKSPSELVQTAVDLQNVVDKLNAEREGWDSSAKNLKRQLDAIQREPSGSPEELEMANKEINSLKLTCAGFRRQVDSLHEEIEELKSGEEIRELKDRCDRLQQLNEKLQEKLLAT